MLRSLIILLCLSSCAASEMRNSEWTEWTPNVFERAKKENKLVLLNLKANWCHWCHVMEDSTYLNPEVIALLKEKYIMVEADHDARPDLAARYRKWGWPATIIFNSQGEEVIKRAGYINPTEFLELLKATIKNPVAEKRDAGNNFAVSADKTYFTSIALPLLETKNKKFIDVKNGGYAGSQKYINWDTYEYALYHYEQDSLLLRWLKNSITNANGLMDKAWGGVYQYSTYGDWDHPHYEKLLSVQARYIKMYTWYAKRFSDKNALKTAENIADYCFRFLWNEGKGFYNAQDADLIAGKKATDYFSLGDNERLRLGVPVIDKHIFTSNNAMMVRSLITLWGATEKEKYLESARQIITYMLNNRRTSNGGFWHDDNQKKVMALADNIPMADALLMMYRVTGKQQYLDEAIKTAEFIHATFVTQGGNYQSDKTNNGLPPEVVLSENIDVCRLFNLLSHVSGQKEFAQYATDVFAYLSSETVLKNISTEPGIMLAYEELQKEPLAGTFLLLEPTSESNNIIKEVVAFPGYYFTNYTYNASNIPQDKKELFSSFDSNVLFFCTSSFCSSPVSNAQEAKSFLYGKSD